MCGACEEVCSFDTIYEGDTQYHCRGERCDDCGSCIQVCPVDAIDLSLVM